MTDPEPLNGANIVTAALEAIQVCEEAFGDQATAFTCNEADALAELIHECSGRDAARAFLHDHSLGDEEGDLHHPGDYE